MGMYTEIILKAEIAKSCDPKVLDVLRYMFNGGPEPHPIALPDHEFFRCARWRMVGSCSSFYHHPAACNSWVEPDFTQDIHIFSRSDLKNYSGEIDKFFEWIQPYLDNCQGECVGWSLYEEDTTPSLYFKK